MDASSRTGRRCRTIWLALCLLLAALAGCQRAATPTARSTPSTQSATEKVTAPAASDGKLLDVSWEAMYMHGAKVGYGRTERRIVPSPEGPRRRTSAQQVLTLKRFDQTTQQTISFVTEETEEGQLLSFESQLSGGHMSLQSQGEIKGGMLKLTTTTAGKKSTVSKSWGDDTLGYFGLEDSLRRQPMSPGEKRQVTWLQPLIHEVSAEQLEAGDYEEVDLLGERKRLLKIKSVATLAGQTLESMLWTDDKGIIWRSSRPNLGQEVYRTTEKVAKAKGDGAFDIGLDAVVKVDRPLESPHATRRVTYRARLKHGDPAKEFSQGSSQSVRSIDEHTAEITVVRVTATEPEEIEAAAGPTEADKRPNNLIQSDDPAVVRLAEKIAGERSGPVDVAVALERGVHERLTNKNFSQAFSTAADVARTLEGDCTEHAVLLAALCRAREIPARVAAGLVYYPPEQGFAYHMWTEAWLNDRWVPLDATLGQGGIGGAHLKLFDSDLDGVGALAAFLPVMNVLGQLELEVLEVQ